MFKLVIINTHGMTVVEGTPIHCYAAYENTKHTDHLARFLYDNRGVLCKADTNGKDITYENGERIYA